MSLEEETQRLRLFVAIFPSAAVLEKLKEAIGQFRAELSTNAIRWARSEQIHLTLNFLGSVDVARVAKLEEGLEAVSGRHGVCQLQAAGLGCFPSERQPRILWAGLSSQSTQLQRLKSDLDLTLAPLGYPPEERSFHPHLTLGRVNRLNAREIQIVQKAVISLQGAEFGQWQVEKLDLMQSVLSPQGAKYTLLKSFWLTRNEKVCH